MTDDRSPDRASLDDVLQECLERLETDGPAVVEEACRRHPELADTLRRRLKRLDAMGLLDGGLEQVLGAPAGMPERLGDFALKRMLGGGGMGVVYLAEQIGLGREVALKIVRPEQLYFPGTRERFRREVETIARLRHPGIVPVHTVGEDGEIPYFAMEWVRGATLAQVLEEVVGSDPATLTGQEFGDVVRRLSDEADTSDTGSWIGHVFTGTWEEACLRVVRQVADALEHAHRQGILHRDVKPSNVMITPAGRAMLLDFGLASAEGTSRLTRTGSQLGSAPYMAPEQIRGAADEIDVRTDVYALAVTLYELLTLRLPFAATTRDELMRRIVDGAPADPSTLHRGLSWEAETVCLCAMETDRERRYVRAGEFARDLGNVLDHHPIEARRAGALRRLRLWVERRPTLAVALLLGGLLVVGAPLGYGLMERSARTRVEEKRALAETNFEDAVAAVESLLAKVGETKLRHVPQVEEIRRELLEDAVAFYERFAERKSDDPDVRFGKARMQLKAGDILRQLGERERATATFRAALDELETLAAAEPDRAELRRHRGYALRNIGVLDSQVGRLEEALDATARAAALQRELVASDAVLPEDRHELAISLMNLAIYRRRSDPAAAEESLAEAITRLEGLVSTSDGDDDLRRLLGQAWNVRGVLLDGRQAADEALDAYGRAVVEFEALVAASPENPDHRRSLAQMLGNLGSSLREHDRDPDVAHGHVERSVAIHRGLTEDFPKTPSHRLDLARALNRLQVRLADDERKDEATAVADEALSILRALVEDASDVPGYRHELTVVLLNHGRSSMVAGRHDAAEAYAAEAVTVAETLRDDFPAALVDQLVGSSWQNVGMARKRLGRLEEACEAYEAAREHQARALEGSPSAPDSRIGMRNHLWMLAETRAELGDHAAGAEAARALAARFEEDGKEQHRAATLLALCVTAAGEDEAAASSYETDAIEFLAGAIEFGFEFDPGDARLDPLRERERFRDLLPE